MAHIHGRPLWFELTTAPGALEAAGAFYARVLGWQIADSGMAGLDYHLAQSEGDMVAGLMEIPADAAGMPPSWTVYLGVDDTDRAAQTVRQEGGQILRPPADIPGTGRFAVVADPQGAVFGLLCPAPMEAGGTGRQAFDQQKSGHGNWIELMTPDPAAALAFYGRLLGWTGSGTLDMGPMGAYHMFGHDGADIGGMMGLGDWPRPVWQPYFGVNGVNPAIQRIRAAGGTILYGPQPVPGEAHIVMATDPQGAGFALVGPLETTL